MLVNPVETSIQICIQVRDERVVTNLNPFQIRQLHEIANTDASALASTCQVLVVEEERLTNGFQAVCQSARQQGVGILVIVDTDELDLDRLQKCIDVADGFARPTDDLVLAVISAFMNRGSKRQLERVATDRLRQLNEQKIIDHARGIIAAQRGISEADALNKLRTEARSRRMSFVQYALSIIHAYNLLEGKAEPKEEGREKCEV
jgi:AmiR/NasT family two-component response regulator